MQTSDLLHIDVDELFEKHTIAEIEEIQKRLQEESERQREELRTMVGERYRDLLKAADTIAEMKETSTCLIDDIDDIITNCKSLNEKQLLGFQTSESHPIRVLDKQEQIYYATVFQIKLLTDLPEMIWTQIDNEQFFVATQLFILARHISTGLQLDVDNSFIRHFPVAKKQWTVLKPFFFTIKQAAVAALEKDSLMSEAATDCLLSLFLLEQSSMDAILGNFLQIRAKAYLATLSSEKSAQRRVKERILSSLEVLNSTIVLIYKCFVDSGNGKGLVTEKLEELASDKAQPTISLMELDETDLHYDLPDIIAKFKPTFQFPTINTSMLATVKSTWLQTVSKIIENQLRGLFELVTSMKTIQEIKGQSTKLDKIDRWSIMCEHLSLPANLDFYQHYYRPLINSRVRDIVRQSWSKTVASIHDQVEQFLRNPTEKRYENAVTLLWKENVADVPLSLKQALQQDRKSNKLLMKCKGYNNDIVEICSTFDDRLKTIISEVNVLLDEDSMGQNDDEKQSMVEFIKETSTESITDLITKIKSLDYEKRQENFVSLARLFTAFSELCPNLKTCLSYSLATTSWERIVSEKSHYEKWNRICSLLDDEAFTLWRQFCQVFIERVAPDRRISTELGLEMMLSDFTVWESISIEEKDEHDNPVKSIISVPSQPRICFQLYLFKLTQTLIDSVPETLPRKVLIHLNTLLASEILKLYGNYVDSDFVKTNQNAALQLYFDLKFFQTVFLARDDRRSQEEVQRLTNVLKNFIDPFDFELFHSYLNTNVKKCIQRLQHALEVLIPHPENLAVLVDQRQPPVATQDRDPNVLCLSSNGASAMWFPPLPIIVQGGGKMATVQSEIVERTISQKPKKQSDSKTLTPSSSSTTLATAQQTAQNYASNVKSGAAAFFGAMSQEWFR